MIEQEATNSAFAVSRASSRPGFVSSLAKRAVLERLGGWTHGELVIHEGAETHRFGTRSGAFPVSVEARIHHADFWPLLAFEGTVGSGEAYVRGYWTCSDLVTLFKLFIANRASQDSLEGGLARLGGAFLAATHALRRNTREGSRRNISQHYDLGNDLYGLFLDETMSYSAGIFASEETPLREAQVAKIDRLCRRLGLRPDHHLLEIGTGWGAFAIHAARNYGCRVTTTTISREQRAFALERVARAGVADRVTVLLEDYRDLRGQYDRLVSVEMIEAVGAEYWGTFMRKCSSLLRPDGVMAMQAILIRDHEFARARREVDFIKSHVFPGCCIPSLSALTGAAGGSSDFVLTAYDDITPHYETTLRLWRERFMSRLGEVRALGYDDSFIRLWEHYLAYCEAGFAERTITTAQMLFARPASRMAPALAVP